MKPHNNGTLAVPFKIFYPSFAKEEDKKGLGGCLDNRNTVDGVSARLLLRKKADVESRNLPVHFGPHS